MTSSPRRNQVLWDRLLNGEDPRALSAEEFSKVTVYRDYGRVQRGEVSLQGTGNQRVGGRSTPAVQTTRDPSATVVRLTQEQIVLPGRMFLLYDCIGAQHPRYKTSKPLWIQDTVQCWATEHAEEIGLDPMM